MITGMKNLLAEYLLLMGYFSLAQSGNYTVSEKIKGLDSKKVYIYMCDESAKGGFRRNSIPVINETVT